MDAVEFLRDFRRMCLSYDNCTGCELRCAECSPTEEDCDHEKVIRVVEEWAKEHPVKTRLSEFNKLFPNYNYPSGISLNLAATHMGVSYKKLIKLLIDRNMNKKDLQEEAALSPASITSWQRTRSLALPC